MRTGLMTGLLLVAAILAAAERLSAAEPDAQLRQRLEQSLDKWCRWLSGYVRPLPDSDLYSMTPVLNTGPPYRDVAGNQFAAAAAAYWLARAHPDPETARPLRGLIKLALGSHVAVATINRADVPRWGAGHSPADNWHADLFAATAGMLMPGALTEEQEVQLCTILTWEADKQIEYLAKPEPHSIPGRWPVHSNGESNAWSAALLQAARVALSDSPRQDAWRRAAIEYSLNSICLPQDQTSDDTIAGMPVRQWVKGANFEPGGIQEHHGFYHPGYIGWPLAYEAFATLMDRKLAPARQNPNVFLRNWKLVFDRLKQGTFANGRFIHCAGDDWNAYGYGNDHILPIAIFAAIQFHDPDASRLADQWLGLMELAQAQTGGAIQGARLGRLARGHSSDFAWYESISGATLAHSLWVLDQLDSSAMPAPSTEQEYNAHNIGTYHEPNARLVWHRDLERWSSVSWRSAFGQWQMIVQPIGLPNLLKFNHNAVGILEAKGATAANMVRHFRIETPAEGGFWSLGVIDRLQRESDDKTYLVRQHQALVVLPDGPAIWIDVCQALDEIELVRTGALGLRLAADLFNDNRLRLSIGGVEQAFGPHASRDTWHDLNTRSLTIEGLLTIHASGEGTFQLLQRRARDPERRDIPDPNDPRAVEESLLSHELYFGPPACETRQTIAPQTCFRKVVLTMNCNSRDKAHTSAVVVRGEPPCLLVELPEDGRSVAVNFADMPRPVESIPGPVAVEPYSIRVVADHP